MSITNSPRVIPILTGLRSSKRDNMSTLQLNNTASISNSGDPMGVFTIRLFSRNLIHDELATDIHLKLRLIPFIHFPSTSIDVAILQFSFEVVFIYDTD